MAATASSTSGWRSRSAARSCTRETAEHLSAVLTHLPPAPGEAYATPLNMLPIPLVDYGGQSTGFSIVSQRIDAEPGAGGRPLPVRPQGTGAAAGGRRRGTGAVAAARRRWRSGSTRRARRRIRTGTAAIRSRPMLTELQLTGTSSLGPVTVELNPLRPSLGEIEELVNNTPGNVGSAAVHGDGSRLQLLRRVPPSGGRRPGAGGRRRRAVCGPSSPTSRRRRARRTPRRADMDADCVGGPERRVTYGDGCSTREMWIVSERLTPIPFGRIRVVKDAQPDDPQDFVFDSPELGTVRAGRRQRPGLAQQPDLQQPGAGRVQGRRNRRWRAGTWPASSSTTRTAAVPWT